VGQLGRLRHSRRSSDRPRWRAALAIGLCQSTQSLLIGGIALFLPLIREELGLSFTEAGTLAASSTLVYALMQIPSGFLADRIGPRHLFIVGLAGTNALALSFALLHEYWVLLANQAISGFFRALVFAPGLMLMTAVFPAHRRATAIGNFFANAGAFTFIYALGALRDSTGTFDLGLYVLAGACGAGAACTVVLSRLRGGSPSTRRGGRISLTVGKEK
jgi:sugar phosphate permease